MKIRIQLAQLRTQHNNITQAELAEKTGISERQLGELENGQASGIEFETLSKLCTFFHCTPNDLLTVEESDETGSATESTKAKAQRIIAQGFAQAMAMPPRSPDEIWAEFDEVRARIANKLSEADLEIDKIGQQ